MLLSTRVRKWSFARPTVAGCSRPVEVQVPGAISMNTTIRAH